MGKLFRIAQVALGVAALIGVTIGLKKIIRSIHKLKNPFFFKIKHLGDAVIAKSRNNPSLFYFNPVMQICKIYKVPFLFLITDRFAKKPIGNIQKSDSLAMPYDKDLFIGELTPTHNLLFNKYVVSNHHVLIVTKDFEEQASDINSKGNSLMQILKPLL